jgi:hypothetical protein
MGKSHSGLRFGTNCFISHFYTFVFFLFSLSSSPLFFIAVLPSSFPLSLSLSLQDVVYIYYL